MRLITLEEHYRSERVNKEIGEAGDYFRTANSAGERMAAGRLANLSELGERRLADMDNTGIDIQVLSHTHPSPEILPAARAIPLCRISERGTRRVGRTVPEAVRGIRHAAGRGPAGRSDRAHRGRGHETGVEVGVVFQAVRAVDVFSLRIRLFLRRRGGRPLSRWSAESPTPRISSSARRSHSVQRRQRLRKLRPAGQAGFCCRGQKSRRGGVTLARA